MVQRGKQNKHLKFSYNTGRVEALPGRAEPFGENTQSFWVKERKHLNKEERPGALPEDLNFELWRRQTSAGGLV